jgi:PhnB protein
VVWIVSKTPGQEIVMVVQPYLDFNGRCEEAIEFYKSAVGAKVNMLMRFKDCPEPSPEMDPAVANKVMHASLQIGGSIVMVSDGRCKGDAKFAGFCLSLSVANDADAKRFFGKLVEGGKITMPLTKTFFASQFGLVDDRFGIHWMVVVQP